MLLDPGPIVLIGDDVFPTPGDPPAFASDAAQLGATLGLHDAAMADQQSTMAGGAGSLMDGEAALDLADAATAHAQQADDFDSSIGAVAGNADAMDGEIAGLSSDASAGVNDAAMPNWPPFVNHQLDPPQDPRPPHPDPQDPHPDPPSDTGDPFADAVIALYLQMLDRVPSAEEIDSHRGNPNGIEGVREAILESDEYRQKHAGGQ
jgi:hypothetical protein